MSCATPERTCPLAQCAEIYRIYINSIDLTAVTILIRNMATGKQLYFLTTPVGATLNGNNISRVSFGFFDFGNFLLSDADFEITVVRQSQNNFGGIDVYLGEDTDGNDILADGITAKFEAYYNSEDTKTTPINPLIFKSVNAV